MKTVQLGLAQNWRQFVLLVVVNAFVGGMVGIERSILPQMAGELFGIAAKTTILSFIVVFGVVKAATNYFTGTLANRFGRKRLLVAGWLVGLPIPFILIYAPNWNWVIAANVLLGIHQGLAWSSTVMMKIDLVGEKQRGFAMGLNEFAGYLAVALVALATGWVASVWGLRPFPFYIGIGLAFTGLALTLFWVKDTRQHVAAETSQSQIPRLKNIFWDTTWRNANLGSVSQAGLINNLNDGMVWGLLPLLLASKGFALTKIAVVTAVYPAVWGIGQLITGKLADSFCKKDMLHIGMLMQATALALMALAQTMAHFVVLAVMLGWGTAMVYPTFLATIAENTHPADRAISLGIFRWWRDLGYAIGALLTGLLADAFGLLAAIISIGLLTLFSAIIIRYRMRCSPSGGLKMADWVNVLKNRK